jgi:hypothetical protein
MHCIIEVGYCIGATALILNDKFCHSATHYWQTRNFDRFIHIRNWCSFSLLYINTTRYEFFKKNFMAQLLLTTILMNEKGA